MYELVAKGEIVKVPLLIGINSEECINRAAGKQFLNTIKYFNSLITVIYLVIFFVRSLILVYPSPFTFTNIKSRFQEARNPLESFFIMILFIILML